MAKPITRLKVRYYKKFYFDGDGKLKLQPIICQRCGYDSATDIVEEQNYCSKCGAKIVGIDGELKS